MTLGEGCVVGHCLFTFHCRFGVFKLKKERIIFLNTVLHSVLFHLTVLLFTFFLPLYSHHFSLSMKEESKSLFRMGNYFCIMLLKLPGVY